MKRTLLRLCLVFIFFISLSFAAADNCVFNESAIGSLRIMTYNIAGENEGDIYGDPDVVMQRLANIIKNRSVEVLVLQAVSKDSQYHSNKNMAGVLSNKLDEIGYHMNSHVEWVDQLSHGMLGMAVFSKFPIGSYGVHWINNPNYWHDRLAIQTFVVDRGGDSLRFINIHFPSGWEGFPVPSSNPEDIWACMAWHSFKKDIFLPNYNDEPVLLMGDFNLPQAMNTCYEDMRVYFREACDQMLSPNCSCSVDMSIVNPEEMCHGPIDHILYRFLDNSIYSWRLKDSYVHADANLGAAISDHYPVFAEFEYFLKDDICSQYSSGDCMSIKWDKVFAGKNDSLGYHNPLNLLEYPNVDNRFICYNSKFYECGWELSDVDFAIKSIDGQRVGSWTCDLQSAIWIRDSIEVVPTCTYTYSDYGECQSTGNKFRTVTSSSPDNCQGNPDLSQQCVYIPFCTGEDWNDIYSPEDCPIDGIQNVSWEKKGVCRGGVNKTGLVEDRTCDPNLPICKSFNYSEWSECGQNFRRTRKVLHSYPLGCQGGNPELGEYCKYEYNVNDSLDNSDDENPVLVEDTGDSSTQSGSSSRDTSELDEILSELSLTENELQVVKSGTKLEAKSSLIDFRDVLENKLLVLGVLSFVLIVILISVVILLRGRR